MIGPAQHVQGPRFVCGWCTNAASRGGWDHRMCSTRGQRWWRGRWNILECQCDCRLAPDGTYSAQSPSWVSP